MEEAVPSQYISFNLFISPSEIVGDEMANTV